MQQVIHLSSQTFPDRDIRLNAAIDSAMSMATKNRAGGILVTRHAPAHFTVAITPEVPYGQVRETNDMTAHKQRRLSRSEQEE
jgi:hypothetical protein